MSCADPKEVGIEQEEEDQRNGHEIHVDTEDDAAVVKAPAALYAADGFSRADYRDQRRQQEKQRWTEMREVGQRDCDEDAGENQDVGTGQGVFTRIEDGRAQLFQYALDGPEKKP